MAGEFFEPAEFFAHLTEVVGNPAYSATRDYFEDDRILDMLSPYANRPALADFASWFADGLLYEVTTDTAPSLLPTGPRKRSRKLAPLPVEDAMSLYRIKADSFAAWVKDSGKKVQEANGDDVYDYFQELRCSGWLEELGERMTNAILPRMLADLGLLSRFQECVAEQVKSIEWHRMDAGVAIMFERPGALRVESPPSWAVRLILERDKGHCAACARAAADPASATLDQLVPCSQGGLNDLGNLRLRCPVRANSRM